MKFKLPLLLLLSLMWQAAALADEWTNIATAVTVTEGRLCAGELAADGTGTDILCDDDHPAIDSSGNVTVSGELSATTLNATQLCDENGTNCTTLSGGLSGVSALASLTDVSVSTPADNNLLRYNTSTSKWEAVGINDGLSTTTVLPNWPDVIVCTGSASTMTFNRSFIDSSYANYDRSGGTDFRLRYNKTTGAYYDGYTTSHSADCNGKSIATLYSDGQAFNYLGNNGAQTSLTEIADVSASAPTDGQLLSYDASEGEWVASDASAGVSALASLTDVSATDPATGSILRYDGTSWTAVADLMTAISTTTMVVGWPDAIRCTRDSGSMPRIFYISTAPASGLYWYRTPFDDSNFLEFNTDQTNYNSTPSGYSDCQGKSIATLYSDGQAFNFLGNNGAQTSMTEIADVSASAPTDGQLLSYDASENEWVATDVISKTIIYNSIDDDPCVVTGGVRKLSFNPTTGRLRVCRP